MGEDLRPFLWAIVICVTIPLIVHVAQVGAISVDAKRTSYIAGLLFDFQGLLTGVLAIFAAYITVREMRRSDERSEVRHKANMDLAIRADRLQVQRALHPQFRELNALRKRLRALSELESKASLDATERAIKARYWAYSEADKEVIIPSSFVCIRDLREILNRPHFIEGAKLFDGDLTYGLWRLTDATEEAYRRGEVLYRHYQMDESDRTQDDQRAYTNALNAGDDFHIIRFPRDFAHMAKPLLDGMSRMAKLYGVREEWSPHPS